LYRTETAPHYMLGHTHLRTWRATQLLPGSRRCNGLLGKTHSATAPDVKEVGDIDNETWEAWWWYSLPVARLITWVPYKRARPWGFRACISTESRFWSGGVPQGPETDISAVRPYCFIFLGRLSAAYILLRAIALPRGMRVYVGTLTIP